MSHVFSRDFIDSEKLDPIPSHLLAWAKKDLRETLEEDLPKADKALKQAERELAFLLRDLSHRKIDPEKSDEVQFLEQMCTASRLKMEFYDGKVHLLKKRIALSNS